MHKKRLLPLADEEEAKIQAGIAADPDNPELTEEELAQMRPFAEVFPKLAENIARSRGRPRSPAPKVAITLRLDPWTVARFQAKGDDWRSQMSKALDKAKG